MSRKSVNVDGRKLDETMLQWGRDKNVSEMMAIICPLKVRTVLQWGRDKNVSEILQPHRQATGLDSLQWGRDKNVSEMSNNGLVHFYGKYGFNGAETKMSRKSQIWTSPWILYRRFNGAETKMSRKSVTVLTNPSHASCFNGAETKMSRKCLMWLISLPKLRPLQWGRDKNVSEINIPYYNNNMILSASMGPRQKCLGNTI